jgi:hypothetical protein
VRSYPVEGATTGRDYGVVDHLKERRGGHLITASDPGVGILANGLLTVPLAAFAICVRATAPVGRLPYQVNAVAEHDGGATT